MASFSIDKRIYLDDTDAFGMVYHGNYLRLLEHARSEWLLQSGITLQTLREQQQFFVIRSAQLNYLKPISLNAQITITATVNEQSRSLIPFQQTIHALDQPDLIYCTATIEVVMINQQSRVVRIPTHILEVLQ